MAGLLEGRATIVYGGGGGRTGGGVAQAIMQYQAAKAGPLGVRVCDIWIAGIAER